jgi:hypothetical protein
MTLNLALVIGTITLAAATAAQSVGRQAETPFFCNLKALTLAERTTHEGLTKRLMAAVQKKQEVPDGYAFGLDSARMPIADLASWVDFERRCCPFFDFQLDWRRDNGAVTLRLTGREGVKDFIRAEFTTFFRK